MNYYLSIQYVRKNPDGTIPEGYDMEFDDSGNFAGKRVTRPRYSDQIPSSKKKLFSSTEASSPFRKKHKMTEDIYEITKKTYETMEEKPELKTIRTDDGDKTGWSEISHQDDHSEIRHFIIK